MMKKLKLFGRGRPQAAVIHNQSAMSAVGPESDSSDSAGEDSDTVEGTKLASEVEEIPRTRSGPGSRNARSSPDSSNISELHPNEPAPAFFPCSKRRESRDGVRTPSAAQVKHFETAPSAVSSSPHKDGKKAALGERGVARYRAEQKEVLMPNHHTADPSARVMNGRLYVIASHDIQTKRNTGPGWKEGTRRRLLFFARVTCWLVLLRL